MRARFVLPLIPLLLGACSAKPITAAGLCTFAAQVNGSFYAITGDVAANRVGPEYTRTLRQRECEDVIVFGQPAPEAWRDGDSSFTAGTPLYTSLDHPASDVLVVKFGEGWRELRYMPPRN